MYKYKREILKESYLMGCICVCVCIKLNAAFDSRTKSKGKRLWQRLPTGYWNTDQPYFFACSSNLGLHALTGGHAGLVAGEVILVAITATELELHTLLLLRIVAPARYQSTANTLASGHHAELFRMRIAARIGDIVQRDGIKEIANIIVQIHGPCLAAGSEYQQEQEQRHSSSGELHLSWGTMHFAWTCNTFALCTRVDG